MGMPPGGPADKVPPILVGVTPDTFALRVKSKEVVFRFNKVISERPRGAQTLDQLVVISPSDGAPNVDWRRQSLAIRPRKGWRANTAYTVTILPGLTDLFGNSLDKALHVTFSTGNEMPRAAVRGIAFDWSAQRVAADARVEAITGADTNFRYLAAADSTGRFALTGMPAATYRVRVYLDQNRNRILDPRELWDSTTIALADSARSDFYLFLHDSIGPRLAMVEVRDSVSLRVRFDKGLAPGSRADAATFTLQRTKDSSKIVVTRAVPAAQYDSLAGRRKRFVDDSVARADTSTTGRAAVARTDSTRAAARNDSIAQAQIAARRAARDTVKREPLPKPARAAPLSEFVLDLAEPLVPQQQLRLVAHDLTSVSGVTRSSERVFTRRPPPKDSTAAPGTRPGTRPGTKPGAAPKDSAAAARPKPAAAPGKPTPP